MNGAVDHVSNLRQEAALLGSLDIDAEAEVPTCPGWDMSTLVVHLGSVHRWMRACLENQKDDLPPRPTDRPSDDPEALRNWLVDGAVAFVDTLTTLQDDAVRSSWAGPQPASWFARRVDLETVVHRWDLENTCGPAGDVPAAIAEDGIEEWLELAGIRDVAPEGRIHLHGTGAASGGEWIIEAGRPLRWSHAHEKGDVALRAPLGRIFLALWGRIDVESLDHFGDMAVARALLDE